MLTLSVVLLLVTWLTGLVSMIVAFGAGAAWVWVGLTGITAGAIAIYEHDRQPTGTEA